MFVTIPGGAVEFTILVLVAKELGQQRRQSIAINGNFNLVLIWMTVCAVTRWRCFLNISKKHVIFAIEAIIDRFPEVPTLLKGHC
jgi:hypothetical protein